MVKVTPTGKDQYKRPLQGLRWTVGQRIESLWDLDMLGGIRSEGSGSSEIGGASQGCQGGTLVYAESGTPMQIQKGNEAEREVEMDWNTLVPYVAIWGALAGTASAVAHVLNWRNQKRAAVPQIKVRLLEGFINNPTGEHGPFLRIALANCGQKPCTITLVAVICGSKTWAVIPIPKISVELPHRIEPEGEGSIFFLPTVLAKNLHDQGFSGKVDLAAIVLDAVGREYKSKSWTFDTYEHLKKAKN